MGLRIPDRLFARYYDCATERYERAVADDKRRLLAGVSGTVVEIGPGTGSNLEYLSPGTRLIGIEPNVHMHRLLLEKAASLELDVDLRPLSAGRMPLEDGAADVVLSTLVLCSVPDVAAALAEVRRVLRPGGRFVFWEHVLAPEGRWRRLFQHAMTPAQRFLASDCRANRDLAAAIRGAGFESVVLEGFEPPREAGVPSWIRPHVRGTAVR
ncbi:MAG: class I SAM-dependent methyltransferase [Planctomycetota bacterium]